MDVLLAAKKYPHIRWFLLDAKELSHICSASLLQFLMYVFASIDYGKSIDFFYLLNTGDGLKKSNPIYQLRETLMQYRLKQLSLEKRLILGSVINTWNAYYLDERPDNIMYKGGNFPVIAGIDRKKLFKKGSGFKASDFDF